MLRNAYRSVAGLMMAGILIAGMGCKRIEPQKNTEQKEQHKLLYVLQTEIPEKIDGKVTTFSHIMGCEGYNPYNPDTRAYFARNALILAKQHKGDDGYRGTEIYEKTDGTKVEGVRDISYTSKNITIVDENGDGKILCRDGKITGMVELNEKGEVVKYIEITDNNKKE